MFCGQRRLIGETELTACGCDPGDTVLVALSGGADSTALLLSLCECRDAGEIGGLFAAHLNHGIRGENANRDQRFCEALCARLEIPLATETIGVPAYAKAHGQSIEQAAREVRYAFLERAREAFHANVIATAHHKDDQAETLLLHLIRGSGTGGLCGMQPRNGRIIRPLLDVSREEILLSLQLRGEPFCEDETNAENGAARNRIRNELMPLLQTLNPGVASALAKTAKLVSEDEAFLRQLSEEAEREISCNGGLERTKLAALAAPIGTRILRRRLMAQTGNVKESDIRRVMALSTAQTGTRIELSGGYFAWTSAELLQIGLYPEPEEYEVPFVQDGETVTPYGVLRANRADGWQRPKDGSEAYLDAGALPKDLVVRSRRNADRFFPLGAPGERKLSDVFTDRKIPKEERWLPLLCAGDQVYYAVGLGVSERARITPNTREILHIIFNRGDRD
ncbi:MAG: tRNA lysidine(34) synthetase TilS [Christensenella sp.]|nr:tRNA lysidine(34) synthetase TilS [Christensenella sp.]